MEGVGAVRPARLPCAAAEVPDPPEVGHKVITSVAWVSDLIDRLTGVIGRNRSRRVIARGFDVPLRLVCRTPFSRFADSLRASGWLPHDREDPGFPDVIKLPRMDVPVGRAFVGGHPVSTIGGEPVQMRSVGWDVGVWNAGTGLSMTAHWCDHRWRCWARRIRRNMKSLLSGS